MNNERVAWLDWVWSGSTTDCWIQVEAEDHQGPSLLFHVALKSTTKLPKSVWTNEWNGWGHYLTLDGKKWWLDTQFLRFDENTLRRWFRRWFNRPRTIPAEIRSQVQQAIKSCAVNAPRVRV